MPIHNQKCSLQLTPYQIPLLITAIFIASIGIGIFTFTLPLLSLDEKASGLWLGTAFSGYFLAKLIIAPLSGEIADRHGPLNLLLISSGLAALLPVIYLIFPSINSLYAIQFILGLCAGTIRTVGMVSIGNISKDKNLTARFSHLTAGINTAFFLGPLLGGFLYIDHNYLPILSALSSCMTISFLLFIFSPHGKTSDPYVQKEHVQKRNNAALAEIMLAIFGRTIGIGGIIAFYPVLIKTSLQLSPLTTGLIFSAPNIATIILLPLTGSIFSKPRHELMVCAGVIISSMGLYLLADCSSITQFILTGSIIGAGAALSIPSSMTLCSKLNPKQGKTLGLANMVANFGFIIGPLLVGFILSFSGDLSISFKWIALAGTLFSLPILYRGISSSSSNKSIQIIPAITCTIIIITALTAFQQNSTFTSNQNQEQDNIRPLFRYTDVAMGTIVNLTLQTTSEGQAEKAALNAIKAMRSSQKDFDHRNKMGSIGRINRAAGIKAVKISDEAFKLIKRSLQLGIQTNGTFDISIGAITTTDFYYVLDDATLNKRRSLVDYKLVEINPEKKSVKLPRKRMALDVGGLAKGTIIDAATDSLKDAGIEAALVEAGGDFNTYGDRIWTIGIKDPRSKGLLGKIEIKNQAVCGSGDYYQFITTNSDNDEARRHHILDPSQMRSSHESIATTAIGPTAETADALATTIFIMGPEAGTDFINKFYPDCSAMWVMPDKSIRKTSNFPALVTSKQ